MPINLVIIDGIPYSGSDGIHWHLKEEINPMPTPDKCYYCGKPIEVDTCIAYTNVKGTKEQFHISCYDIWRDEIIESMKHPKEADDCMENHALDVRWHFTVPHKVAYIDNMRHVIISQRIDGPFRDNLIGGCTGFYHVSVAVYSRRKEQWEHIEGSTSGGFNGFEEAKRVAREKWTEWKDHA